MKFRHLFTRIAGFSLVVMSLLATPAATAQAVISNETLVTTTCGLDPLVAPARTLGPT